MNFVTIWVFQFCHNLSSWVWDLSLFELEFFYQTWVLSQIELCHSLTFVTIWVRLQFYFCQNSSFATIRAVTIWVFEFCHTLSFWVLSQFEFFLNFVTIWVWRYVTILVSKFHHNLSLIFFILSQFEFLSFITVWVFLVSWQFVFLSFIAIWFFEFDHNLSSWVSSQYEFWSFIKFWMFEFFGEFFLRKKKGKVFF